MNLSQTSGHSEQASSETLKPRNRFGWMPIYDTTIPPIESVEDNHNTMPRPVSATKSTVLKSSESFMSTPQKSLANSKRTSNMINKGDTPLVDRRATSYTEKRDRRDTLERSKSFSAASAPLSPMSGGSRVSTKVSTPLRSVRLSNTPSSLGARSAPIPSTSGSSHPSSGSSHPSSGMKPAAVKGKKGPLFRFLPMEELPEVFSPELRAQLSSSEFIEIPEVPSQDSIGHALESLQQLEQLCSETSVMKMRSPETKIKERITELDVIVDNAREVLKRTVEMRNACVAECDSVELSYYRYFRCIEHNHAIAAKLLDSLNEQNDALVEVVGSLFMQGQEVQSALNDTTSKIGTCRTELEEKRPQKDLLAQQKEQATRQLNGLKTSVADLRDTVEELRERLEEVEEVRTQREAGVRSQWKAKFEVLEGEMGALSSSRAQCEKEQAEKERALQQELGALTDELGSVTSSAEEHKETHSQSLHAESMLQSELSSLSQSLGELESALGSVRSALQQAEEKHMLLVQGLESRRGLCESELSQLNDAVSKLEEDYRKLRVSNARKEGDRSRSSADVCDMRGKRDEGQSLLQAKSSLKQTECARCMARNSELEDIRDEERGLTQQIAERRSRLAQLQENVVAQEDLYQSDKRQLNAALDEQRHELEYGASQWLDERVTMLHRKDALQSELPRLAAENDTLASQLRQIQASATQEESQYLNTLHELQQQIQALQDICATREAQRAQLQHYQTLLQALDARAATGERTRRRLHNRIQEIRGNLRVLARVRPLFPQEGSTPAVIVDKGAVIVTHRGKEQRFVFDGAFDGCAGQSSVFDEVELFVQSALDGYDVCLFTYGQTGSGKTFTMQGDAGERRGIVPRSIEKIMDEVGRLRELGWEYSLRVSLVEIYMEVVYDLLVDKKLRGKLEVRLDREGHPIIPEVRQLEVQTPEHIQALMDVAARSRAVGSTDMNDESSRSHMVFTLYLEGRNTRKAESVQGRLYLVDLAGSERLDKSHSVGNAQKEALAINRSLSALSNVFINIRNGNDHVNYRDSKLTLLLKDCLSREGKTLMIVNLSPAQESAQESLCSLNFAATANQCKQGQAKRKITKTK